MKLQAITPFNIIQDVANKLNLWDNKKYTIKQLRFKNSDYNAILNDLFEENSWHIL